jgi:hypothetical protein
MNGCREYRNGFAGKQRLLLSLRLGAGLLAELFEIPRDDTTGFYVGYSFVDRALERNA